MTRTKVTCSCAWWYDAPSRRHAELAFAEHLDAVEFPPVLNAEVGTDGHRPSYQAPNPASAAGAQTGEARVRDENDHATD